MNLRKDTRCPQFLFLSNPVSVSVLWVSTRGSKPNKCARVQRLPGAETFRMQGCEVQREQRPGITESHSRLCHVRSRPSVRDTEPQALIHRFELKDIWRELER